MRLFFTLSFLIMASPAMAKTIQLPAHPDATCGNMLYIDKGSWFDAPAYYTDKKGHVLAFCSGKLSDKQCPPKGWTCPPPDIDAIAERYEQENR